MKEENLSEVAMEMARMSVDYRDIMELVSSLLVMQGLRRHLPDPPEGRGELLFQVHPHVLRQG